MTGSCDAAQWDPYYITTPIYYVNAEPHLGHAYTTIAADVATRHARQRGEDAFFLTGTDEHGAKVAQAAAAAGLEPKAWADPIAERFRELARSLDARLRLLHPHDRSRARGVRAALRRRCCASAATSTRARTPGLYCTACETFYREEDLVDGRCCPQHGTVPEWTEEKNLFFRLSAFRELAARALRRASRLRAAARAHERDARLRRGRARGSLDHAPGCQLGRAGAVGHRAVDLRLGRRAAQLRLGADLRAARRGSDRDGCGRRAGRCSARTSCASTRSSGPRC